MQALAGQAGTKVFLYKLKKDFSEALKSFPMIATPVLIASFVVCLGTFIFVS